MNLSDALEIGAETIVETEPKTCVTEWQEGRRLSNRKQALIDAKTQQPVAVKAGKRLENPWEVKQTILTTTQRNNDTR